MLWPSEWLQEWATRDEKRDRQSYKCIFIESFYADRDYAGSEGQTGVLGLTFPVGKLLKQQPDGADIS